MPLPTPKSNEDKDNFIARCTSELSDMGEFESNKQRVAVCYKQLRKKNEMSTEERIDSYLNERKAGTQSPKKLADQLEAKMVNELNRIVDEWKKEKFGALGETEYETQLDEVFAIVAKRMKTYFEGMKKGAQRTLRSKR